VVRTKQLIRSKVWFLNIDKLVKDFVHSCSSCQATIPFKHRDPIITARLTKYSFEQLDIDYAGPFPNGKYLFVIVDEFSRFPFIEIISSTSFKHLEPILLKIFGLPKIMRSDNGPSFNSHELKNFFNEHNIYHERNRILVRSQWNDRMDD